MLVNQQLSAAQGLFHRNRIINAIGITVLAIRSWPFDRYRDHKNQLRSQRRNSVEFLLTTQMPSQPEEEIMSNKWKDRVIRGGIVVVSAMGLIGAMVGLTGIAVGYPGVVLASVIILAVAACTGTASVIVVNIPSRSRTGRRR